MRVVLKPGREGESTTLHEGSINVLAYGQQFSPHLLIMKSDVLLKI